jgi:hypothetical protein
MHMSSGLKTGVYAWVISKCARIYIYIMFIYTRVYIGIYMSISNMYVYIIYMCSLKPGNCGGGEGWGGVRTSWHTRITHDIKSKQ